MFAWVQRCSSCGYCAPSIAEGTPSRKEIVESAAYRALLAEADLPELARSFLCSSMIFEELGEEAFAARNAIEAAWVCDDETQTMAPSAAGYGPSSGCASPRRTETRSMTTHPPGTR